MAAGVDLLIEFCPSGETGAAVVSFRSLLSPGERVRVEGIDLVDALAQAAQVLACELDSPIPYKVTQAGAAGERKQAT